MIKEANKESVFLDMRERYKIGGRVGAVGGTEKTRYESNPDSIKSP
jgi:hypothetical protein